MSQEDISQSPPVRTGLSIDPNNTAEEDYGPVTPGIYGPELGNTSPESGYVGHGSLAGGLHESQQDESRSHSLPNASHTGNPDEVLRRLSLQGQSGHRSRPSEIDPREAHPSLNLSGSVISASFCVPYKVAYAEDEWQIEPRHGTSALFGSLQYLASAESHWNHTLVGWTGEFDYAAGKGPRATGADGSHTNAVPLNRASAPIPVDSSRKPQPADEPSEIKVSAKGRERLERQLEREAGGRVAPVWLWDRVDENGLAVFKDQKKWRRYAEHEIFTLFHYKTNEPSDGRETSKAWTLYHRMNQAFADTIVSVYKPGDIIVVHDYHLLLLPNMLRQRLPNCYIGFFLHVPFPSSEFYRCLNRRKELLEGTLAANMIGFQAFSYSRHFSSCSSRILGFDSSSAGVDTYGAHVAVDVFPIGINAEATYKAAFESPDVESKMKRLRELYGDKRIIVGRDRLDAVRGVAQKLQAFELFLERHPQWRDKVVLIQVTSPTSIEDQGEKADKTANKISELVARINGTYGSLSSTPVQHYPQYLSREEYFALLRVADVGLITSVRDGMNTTALEYVVCQRDNHGPLIISEFSGTAGSLGNAMHINPWDLIGTADALDVALNMTTEERQTNHIKLYKHVTTNTVQHWTTKFLKRLLTNLASFNRTVATPALDRDQLTSQYKKAAKRLFLFDYDGTLTPIVKDPQAAIPTDKVIRTLKMLASNPKNVVWIISGRDQAFLQEWMGHIPELGLSAEHGCFMRSPNSSEWENLTESTDMSWQKEVVRIFGKYEQLTQGSFTERKKVALTWHYRRADPELGAHNARECARELNREVSKHWDVEVMAGKANLEVRPRFVNKGEIAKKLIREYGGEPGQVPDFVLCLGDDFTDEDMFRSLRSSNLPRENIFAVTVGPSSKHTIATWHLLEPADVISTIAQLNEGNEGH
ncbi:hypothetical protein AMS68_003996 [Peltaster fructicola]|uniref:Uncharacterized protein n=1 Tax=Peltaster fructicola TaxID=286661 RepID=A0A6H0XV23_9PEZI|nr:hypothetical protein AMS68_003996 [Peltaster fructicola]